MIDTRKFLDFYKSLYPKDLVKKAGKIKLLAFDVDGVLTDGGLYFDKKGYPYEKSMNVGELVEELKKWEK